MSIRFLAAATAMLGLLAISGLPSAVAQGKPPSVSGAQSPFMKIFEYRLFSAGADFPCAAEATICEVPIEISQISGPDGNLYCLAKLPETISIKGTQQGGGENNITVVWKLNIAAGIDRLKYSFAFQEDAGILIVADKPPPKKMHDGKRISVHEFSFKNKRNKKPAVATYLPIVLQTETKLGAPSVETLCAAADPKIVND